MDYSDCLFSYLDPFRLPTLSPTEQDNQSPFWLTLTILWMRPLSSGALAAHLIHFSSQQSLDYVTCF